jgi:pimeloyl-ACP methyl ester carboxylesterase
VSGGAPFAVAAAATLKNRVNGLALVAPVGPMVEPNRTTRLGPFHVICFRILPRLPGAIGAVFHGYRAGLAIAPNLAMWIAMSRSNRADREAIGDAAIRSSLIDAFRSGLVDGVAGPVTDMALFGQPWEVELADVSAPARIWIGLEDTNVPITAVRALAAGLPGSDLLEMPWAGHLWVAENAHVVLAWLAQVTARSGTASSHV